MSGKELRSPNSSVELFTNFITIQIDDDAATRVRHSDIVGQVKGVCPGKPTDQHPRGRLAFKVAAGKPAQGRLGLRAYHEGGQVNIEILNENLNVARFFTPYIYGLYRQGPAALWVTAGDYAGECHIYRTRDGFASLERFGDGGQTWTPFAGTSPGVGGRKGLSGS